MAERREGEMTTPELEEELRKMRANMDAQATDRHKLNNNLSSSLLDMGARQLNAQKELIEMRNDITASLQISERTEAMVTSLTIRLVGNEELRQQGLIDELANLKTQVDQAIVKLESVIDQHKIWRNRVIGGFSILTVLGAAVTWVLSHWPFNLGK